MTVLSIAAIISAFALGRLAARRFRCTAPMRGHGGRATVRRVLPPPLPQSAPFGVAGNLDVIQVARERLYVAMGVADEFLPAGRWRCE